MLYFRSRAVNLFILLLVSTLCYAQPTTAGSEFQVNSYTTSGQGAPDVAKAANGDFVVVWSSGGSSGTDTDGTSTQGQVYAADGSTIGSQFQVNTYTTQNNYPAAVATETNGDFVVVWNTYGANVRGQRYQADSSTLGSEFVVSTTTYAYSPDIGMDSDGDFVVSWRESNNIFARRYDNAGAALTAPFQVNTYSTSNQNSNAIGMSPTGEYVITWFSNGSSGTDTSLGSIQAQLYNSAGATVGGQFQVNSETTGNQNGPAVAMLSTGEFVIAWESAAFSPANVQTIQAQRYAADGTPLGTEFGVNAFTTGSQIFVAVGRDDNDNYLFSFGSTFSTGTDSAQQSIQFRAFDSMGTPFFDEFQVNSYTTDNQQFTAVAADANGDLVVVWQSNGSSGTDTDGGSIQGQRYGGPVPVELTSFVVE